MKYALALLVVVAIPDAASARVLDLATRSEAGGPHEVGFCTRPSPNEKGFPGHAFVSFAQGIGGGRKFLAVGRTIEPRTATSTLVGSYFGNPAPGLVREELYSHIRQNCLTVRVNADRYHAARAQAIPRLAALNLETGAVPRLESYSIGRADCITFIIDVAEQLEGAGLKVPVRTSADLPQDYIQKLDEANQ